MNKLDSKNIMCQANMFLVTFPSGSVWLTDASATKIEKELELQGYDESLTRTELREQPCGHFFFKVSGRDAAQSLSEQTGIYGWSIFTQDK
jgi:hypothetical protein